jgi:capsular exopolysaccharide synthesis family protein
MADEGGPLQSLIRRAPLVVLCALLAAAVALGWSLLQDKRYMATADLLVDSGRVKDTPAWLVKENNTERAAAEEVIRQTVDDLGGDLSYQQVSQDVDVEADRDSERISVTATASDARLAAQLANSLAQNAIPQLQGDAELLSRARVPDSPSSPKIARNTAVGAVLGLMLGAVFALLVARLDRRVRRVEELEGAVGPLIGTIPTSKALARFTQGDDSTTGPAAQELPFEESEAFLMLGTRLRYLDSDHPLRTVVVTSSLPGEGKTTVAANLAMAQAMTGSSICLIEADLRKPGFARATGLRERPGLAEVLTGHSPLGAAIQPISEPNGTAVRRDVNVIVAGSTPPKPVELTKSREMEELVTELSRRYELVVVDAPPPTLFADAIPLLKLADGVLVIAQVGRSTPDTLARLRAELQMLDARVIGVVANRAPQGSRAPMGQHYRTDRAPARVKLSRHKGSETGREGSRGPNLGQALRGRGKRAE